MSSHLLGAAALSIYTRWFIMKNECQRCHWNYTWRGGGVGGRGEGVGIEITDNITYDIRKRFPLPRLFVLAAARFHYWVRWRSWRGQNFCLRLLWIYWPTDQCPQYQWLLWWCGKLTRMTKMKEAVISQKLLKKHSTEPEYILISLISRQTVYAQKEWQLQTDTAPNQLTWHLGLNCACLWIE